MGNICNKIYIWYEKYMKRQFPQEPEPVVPTDGDFHTEKIRRYGDILRNTKLPLEERARMAYYIGLLAYTGGVTTSVPASDYIEDMTDILMLRDTSRKVRIAVLKGLCGVCYLSYSNQNLAKELLLTDILLSFLDEDEDEDEEEPTSDDQDIIIVKFWVCYLMTVVCCNNIPYLKLFQDLGGEMLENRLESLSSMEWFGWPMNYAEVLLSLLGYQTVTLD